MVDTSAAAGAAPERLGSVMIWELGGGYRLDYLERRARPAAAGSPGGPRDLRDDFDPDRGGMSPSSSAAPSAAYRVEWSANLQPGSWAGSGWPR